MFEIKNEDIYAMFEHDAYGVTGFKVWVTPNVKNELTAKGVRFTPCKKFDETGEAFLAKISKGCAQSEIVIHNEEGKVLDVGDTEDSLNVIYLSLARGLVTHCELTLRLVPWYLDENRKGTSAVIKKANFTVLRQREAAQKGKRAIRKDDD